MGQDKGSRVFCKIKQQIKQCLENTLQQGSHRLFGSTIEDFFHFPNKNFFFRSQGYQIGDQQSQQRTGKRQEPQAFFMMHYKSTVTTVQCGYKRVLKVIILCLNVLATGKIRPRGKLHLLWSTCCISEKKMQNFCTFSRQLVPENWFTNFKTFLGIKDSKRNQLQNHLLKVKEKRKSCVNLWWKTSDFWIDIALRTSAGVL